MGPPKASVLHTPLDRFTRVEGIGNLSGSRRPSMGRGRSHKEALHGQMHWLADQGVKHLVSLKPDYESDTSLCSDGDDCPDDMHDMGVREREAWFKACPESAGCTYTNIPMPDYDAGDGRETVRFLYLMDRVPREEGVHVHCDAGCGRTGHMIAAQIGRVELTADDPFPSAHEMVDALEDQYHDDAALEIRMHQLAGTADHMRAIDRALASAYQIVPYRGRSDRRLK